MLPSAVRKLSYNPVARTIAQRLHAGALARSIYCRLLSRDGVLHFSCLGVSGTIRTHGTSQLAFVDCVVTREKDVIEETLRHLGPGDTFVDMGSHYGVYSVLASKIVGPSGRVVAVEPHPETFRICCDTVALNQCRNVEILNVAFTNETGELSMSFNENGSHRQRPSDSPSSVHLVPAMIGDEALEAYGTPAAIKVDVEGHEFAVLSGLRRVLSDQACRLLCVEIHPDVLPHGVTSDLIFNMITEFGFNRIRQMPRSSMANLTAGSKEILAIATR